MEKPRASSSELYDKNYYLHSLPGLEHLAMEDVLDLALDDTMHFGPIAPGDHILDFGCGRGALVIALAKRGCTALGVDFSKDAIDFACEFLKRFPEEIQKRVELKQMNIADLNSEREFNAIVFNQVYEHLYDWELEVLMEKFRSALKSNGVLVISTPNLNYIRYLYPLKRILEFPLKVVKELLRILRRKSKHASSVKTFFKEIFKIRYPESEHTRLHVNLQTPSSIRKFMEWKGFRVNVKCVDHHPHLLSLLTRRWWGETIWLSCRLK